MGHVTYTEQIEATPEQIWPILTDISRLPDWAYRDGRYPYPVEGKYGSEQREGAGTLWVGVSADGQTATQKITRWEPPTRLVYELQALENAPLEMTQVNTFELSPAGPNTNVTWSIDWSVKGGFSLNALLIRFTGDGNFEEMIAGSLQNLKQLVESEIAASAIPAEASEIAES
jgi:uncharacterized protein YndB with AHSA1/START domain